VISGNIMQITFNHRQSLKIKYFIPTTAGSLVTKNDHRREDNIKAKKNVIK